MSRFKNIRGGWLSMGHPVDITNHYKVRSNKKNTFKKLLTKGKKLIVKFSNLSVRTVLKHVFDVKIKYNLLQRDFFTDIKR